MDKLLDEIESYWSTRTEGYSEVNEKELNGMQKRAWLETLERGFFGKRSGKNEDSENNSVEKKVFEEEFSEKQHTDKYKDHLRILDIGTGHIAVDGRDREIPGVQLPDKLSFLFCRFG